MKVDEITLFEPTVRDMRREYPELKEYEEFKDLTARELKFCWYMGNRTSPIAGEPPKLRIKLAVESSYSMAGRKKEAVNNMLKGVMPAKLKNAIERMATFLPSVRLRARMMNEYVFDQLQELIILSPEQKKSMDMDDRKKYADLSIKVALETPKVVQQLEGGYGLNVVYTDEDERDNEVVASIRDTR